MKSMQDFAKQKAGNERQRSNKCVIYTRVSSKDQADKNGSLQTQMKHCMQFAQNKHLEVVQFFGGTYESAKSDDDRKEYQRMLKYVNQHKTVTSIVVYSLDRFSRTGSQASSTIEKLRQRGVEVKAVQQDFDTTDPSGQMMQGIMMQFARMDNEMRKQKCVAGMQEKLRQGYWVHVPPKGYTNLNKHVTADQHRLIINEEGKLIRKAYEMRHKGYSFRQITEKLQPLGFTTQERHVGQLLENPFYAGFITDKLIPGEIVKGKHPALISEAVFLKVNRTDEPEVEKRSTTNHAELPLKSFAKEEDSRIPFTGYIAKKGDIPYYKTRYRGKATNINAKKLNDAFRVLIDQFNIGETHIETLNAKVEAKLKERITEHIANEKALTKDVNELKKNLESVEEKYVQDEIDLDVYGKYKDKFKVELRAKEALLSQVPIKSSNLEKAVKNGVEICRNPLTAWDKSDYIGKRNLQKLLFPAGILVSKEKRSVRTECVNEVILEIAHQSGVLAHKKTGETEFEIDYSRVVVPPGIEPGTQGFSVLCSTN